MRKIFGLAFVALALSVSMDGQQGAAGPLYGSANFVGLEALIVPPIDRSETTAFIDAGTIVVDGANEMVLNFAGELKDNTFENRDIGVILVPDLPPYRNVFDREGLLPIAIEITARAGVPVAPYFTAEEKVATVGFTRYRVLLYNETGRTATVFFYVYLRR